MNTNEFLYQFRARQHVYRPYVVCADGFGVSIQASDCHYCTPRISQSSNGFIPYKNVKIGFPSVADDDLMDYIECCGDPCESVYAYVPVEVVDKVLEKHGGIDFTKMKADFEDRYKEWDEANDPWYNIMRNCIMRQLVSNTKSIDEFEDILEIKHDELPLSWIEGEKPHDN